MPMQIFQNRKKYQMQKTPGQKHFQQGILNLISFKQKTSQSQDYGSVIIKVHILISLVL
jgi:hypothetical protein